MAHGVNVVTGATGLLGSHIVEALVARGEPVRAVVRPTSDLTSLRGQGVDSVTAPLDDAAAVRRAFDGAAVVYHCAAPVGNWGPRAAIEREIVGTTRVVLEAAAAADVGRVLHVSSVSVYGHPGDGGPLSEDAPLGQRRHRFRDHYARAKIAAEHPVRAAGRRATVVRPSWVIGPRDRSSMPRLAAASRGGWVSIVGSGTNLLNVVAAADVADGAIRAASHPGAAGRAYNLCSDGELTQREFLTAVAVGVDAAPPRRRLPSWAAHAGGLLGELIGLALGMTRPPYCTRYSVGLLTRPARFSTARARAELGWEPRVGAREGLRQAVEWCPLRAPG
jgi:nucleoside-diphosphate-sugar epimerase